MLTNGSSPAAMLLAAQLPSCRPTTQVARQFQSLLVLLLRQPPPPDRTLLLPHLTLRVALIPTASPAQPLSPSVPQRLQCTHVSRRRSYGVRLLENNSRTSRRQRKLPTDFHHRCNVTGHRENKPAFASVAYAHALPSIDTREFRSALRVSTLTIFSNHGGSRRQWRICRLGSRTRRRRR
jgi:hypothetical protein